jgi:two-component system, NtrC family, response regulator AtoC
MPGTMLVIDDENLIRWSIKKEFEERGFEVRTAHNAATGLRLFIDDEPDITLLDIKLPDKNGIDLLKEMKKINREALIILITSFGGVESAVTAIKEGAYDYIEKPFQFKQMEITINRALEKIQLKKDIKGLTNREKGAYSFDQITATARSNAMKEVLLLARKVAVTDYTTVLLQGESGTGKDLLAKVIHYESARALKPYIEINCTALPDTLIESELFGFEKGSFTDAKQAKKGLFEIADGGTVYVDEIGDVKPSTQVKLLHVLEEKKFKHIGGSRDIAIDVRVIAATNRSLEKEVEKGNFRQDLYYRLKVLPIYVPPLRERKEDIIPLANYFIANFTRKLQKEIIAISPDAKRTFLQYHWPGNVRELKNMIEHIMILHDTDIITRNHLPVEFGKPAAKIDESPDILDQQGHGITVSDDGIDLAEIEKEFIKQALVTAKGNKTRAAKLLKITRDALRYRIQKLNV